MLTINFDRFTVSAGDRLLDLGCGSGRHAFAAYRRGAHVIALDLDTAVLKDVRDTFHAMGTSGEAPSDATALAVRGNGKTLSFADAAFDRIVISEVLEHLHDDTAVLTEAARVLRPGGLLAVSVPRWFPERICWALSDAYHEVEGGHVKIYRRQRLLELLHEAGFIPFAGHHAHALHSPYWWLKCAVGVHRDTAAVRAYHRFLCWDIMRQPRLTRWTERLLNPVLGKSLVIYARKQP